MTSKWLTIFKPSIIYVSQSQPCEAGEVVVWSSSPSQSPYTDEARAERKSENTTESVRVASSFHVAEIVGKQGE